MMLTMSAGQIQRIGFVGFGEVGGIYSQDLAATGRAVVVYDLLFADAQAKSRMAEKAVAANVRIAGSLKELIEGVELVLAATTASSAVRVAKASSDFLKIGQTYVDMNSVSPDTKKEIDTVIRASGADFVEAAVMAAVKTARLKTPILMGGARAAWLADELQKAGLDTSAASEKIGVASAIKMCRSVVMKGLASLAIESLFTARRYSAEEAVLASFDQTYPSMGWKGNLPDQLVMRSVEHSKRRAAEMRESAETVNLSGLTSRMAIGAAQWQDWLTSEMEAGHYTYKPEESFSWQAVADAMDHRANK
jgi:3-hydroxyisobutyrate dehydrogenase-like beta-hydroxyacid dehydrogenase